MLSFMKSSEISPNFASCYQWKRIGFRIFEELTSKRNFDYFGPKAPKLTNFVCIASQDDNVGNIRCILQTEKSIIYPVTFVCTHIFSK